MKLFRLAVCLWCCLLIGCDQVPTALDEADAVKVLNQRLLLEGEYEVLKNSMESRFLQWKALTLNPDLIEADLVIEQTDAAVEQLSLKFSELSLEYMPESIQELKKESQNLNSNYVLLALWQESKLKAISGQSAYGGKLENYQLGVDDFDVDSWDRILAQEADEYFAQATSEYQILIQRYDEKIADLDNVLLAKQAAELTLNTWESILPVKGRALQTAKNASDAWDVGKVQFLALMFDQAGAHFQKAQAGWLKAYEEGLIALSFPSMVKVVGGEFTMGDEAGIGDKDERPLKLFKVSNFNMSRNEVTFSQYDTYARANNLPLPRDEGWGRGDRPVINISWQQAQGFVKWLSTKTGKHLRLPKEVEWEYAAKAGQPDPFNHSDQVGSLANCEGCYRWGNTESTPVGQFPANPFGLHDMQGNVWEWTNDCYEENSEGCQKISVRGGSWYDLPSQLRASNRSKADLDKQSNRIGFRIVEDLNTVSIAQE